MSGSDGSYANNYSYQPFGEVGTSGETAANSFTQYGQGGFTTEDNGLSGMGGTAYDAAAGQVLNSSGVVGDLPVDFCQVAEYWCDTVGDTLGATYGTAQDIVDYIDGESNLLSTVLDIVNVAKDIDDLLEADPGSQEERDAADLLIWHTLKLGLGWVPFAEPYLIAGDIVINILYSDWLADLIDIWSWQWGRFWARPNSVDAYGRDGRGWGVEFIRSHDPNDITGPQGVGTQNWIAGPDQLGYTIRCENDAEKASAPAQVIRITQQLDSDLDWSSFRLGDFGFSLFFIDVPDDVTSYEARLDVVDALGIYIDVKAGIDLDTGEIFWELVSVDPETGDLPADPFAGFLPPNRTPPEGDAWFNYTVSPKATVNSGDVIDAQARIVFDVNPPIDTPAIFNTLDTAGPTSAVDPLPAEVIGTEFSVTWSGQDNTNGSGIATYDLYVSDNGAEYTLWLADTEDESGIFTGQASHTYAFYSTATDLVGHVEAAPTTPDATTRVNVPNATPTVAADNATVAVPEGDPAQNTGTFNDDDLDDVVEVTASVGTIVQSGTQSGTWEWSYTPADGPTDGQTVVITATDSQGASTQTSFELTVDNVAPTVDAGGEATIDEGGTFTGSGSFTDPGTDTWIATVDYGDGTGVQPLILTGTIFALDHTYLDNGVFTVTVVVMDDDGGMGQDGLTVTVHDLGPVASLAGNTALDEGQSGSFNAGGSASYPDAIISYEWDWEYDGMMFTASGDTGATQSHVWMDNGTYLAAVRVTDDDGSTAIGVLSVTVSDLSPTASLTGDMSLDEGQSGSFDSSGSVSYPDGIVSSEWDWDYDGTTFVPSGDIGPVQTHTWMEEGTYTVAVRVTDDDGSMDVATLAVTVRDAEAPVVTVDPLLTNDSTPRLTGTVDDPDASIWVIVAGTTYSALNNGDGTWTLPDNTISPPLADGTYDVVVTATDLASNVGVDATFDELTIQRAEAIPTPIDHLVTTSLHSNRYDRRTGQSLVHLKIKNTSDTVIEGPVWVVIKAIGDPAVTLADSSGVTSDGYLYVDVTSLLPNGRLDPGKSINLWLAFQNPLRRRFDGLQHPWRLVACPLRVLSAMSWTAAFVFLGSHCMDRP